MASDEHASPPPARPAGGRILVAEDEPNSRDIMLRRLRARGYEAEAVADGRAALDVIRRGRLAATAHEREGGSAAAHGVAFDLVLMDLAMPNMGGLDALRALRRSWSPDSLPVIMVSAMIDSDDVVEALEAGANDYVVKPVNFRVLQARIEACLRLRRTVTLLVEAERSRVRAEAVNRSAAELALPLARVLDELETMLGGTGGLPALPPPWPDALMSLFERVEHAVETLDALRKMEA